MASQRPPCHKMGLQEPVAAMYYFLRSARFSLGLVFGAYVAACSASGAGNPGLGPTGESGSGNPAGGTSGTSAGGTAGTDIVVDPGDQAKPPNCGDGNLTSDEACDDGNKNSGDGCREDCLQVEPGYSCVKPGELCRQIARCGDGVVAFS